MGRAAANNLAPAATGAAKAVTRALPQYEGKFDGIAVRTPVPVGSISDITFIAERKTTVEELNAILEEESKSNQYKGVLAVTNEPVVSSDIIKRPEASIVDLEMTRVVDGDLVKVMAWYDNECGFTNQLIKQILELKLKIDNMEMRYPIPSFNEETAKQKIQMAEDAWNSKDPERVAKAYTVDSEWLNRNQFIHGTEQIVSFLTEKWEREINYKLKKEYWAHTENRIAVRFEYEYQDASGRWFRAYGNENWEFDESGLMKKRFASINDLAIDESERKL